MDNLTRANAALTPFRGGFLFNCALLRKSLWRRKLLLMAIIIVSAVAGVLFSRVYPATFQAESSLLVADTQSLSTTAVNSTSTPRFNSLAAHVALLDTPGLQQEALAELPRAARKAGFAGKGIAGRVVVAGDEKSNIITVKVRANDAKAAALLANRIVILYQQQDNQQRREDAARQRAYAEIARLNAQQNFLRANNELSDFKAKSGLLAPEEQMVQFSAHLLALQEEAQRTRAAASAAEQSLRVLSGELKQLDASLLDNKAFSTNPKVAEKLRQLDQLAKARAALLKENNADSPEVQQLDKQITDLEQELQAQAQQMKENSTAASARVPALSNYYATLVTLVTNDVKNKSLQPAIAALKEQQKKLPAEAGKFAELQLAVTIQQENLLQIEKEFQQLALREKSIASAVRPGPPAIASAKPLFPDSFLVVILFSLAGLIIGVAGISLLEQRGGIIFDGAEAEVISGLAVLGNITPSPTDDAYQVLRNNLLFSKQFAGHRLLTIVNADPDEGANVHLLKLAAAMAMEGKEILLLDGDLLNPTLHKLLALPNERGLAEVINGTIAWKEAVVATNITGLSLMPAGLFSATSVEILTGSAGREVLQKLLKKFDVVLIASPPVSRLSEVQLISSLVDGLLLQINIGKSARRNLHNILTSLRMINAPLFGLIIDHTNTRSRVVENDESEESIVEEELIAP